ncbi:NfeD family protein [Edaphosphingomonas haloaromaticamans]|uniref:NfeD family protein n=1 Tax=Edaphosphingomonas haloaromaticamans TaxID=653954 RepID=UPI0020C79D19|nr:nodulation protein NfeD [Sphingomonas haloaromaticamans]
MIGPATADYVTRGLTRAAEDRAPFVVIEMNTPGGLDASMRKIIQAILRSPAPVVAYVSPSGGRAASAGAFILYASHIAAMAPGTNVGAATPVQLGGSGSPFASPPDKTDPDKRSSTPPSGRASEAKAVNDAIAYIRSLAELRGRNVDWAEAAVRNAASLSAQAALEQKVIDVIARDRTELLAQVNGRSVTAGGVAITIATHDLTLVDLDPNWRTRLLAAITDPNIALILMMVGIYGLLFEFMNPGALYPGTIGAICLLTGLYALTALPVNYAGVGLILLGLGLMTAEAFAPSFGILGIGGTVAFVLGAAIMIDTDIPQFQISWPVVGIVALASLGLTIVFMRLALKAHRRKVVTGREELVGSTGTVLDWKDGKGHIFVHSERWQAQGVGTMNAGATVRVTALKGLVLRIEPYEHAGLDESAAPHLKET